MQERHGFYSRDRYSHIRLNAMLDAIAMGTTKPEELEAIANNSQSVRKKEIGFKSENKFLRLCSSMDIVDVVYKSSTMEDQEKGIDYWIDFKSSLNLPTIPAQIKSSIAGVQKFRKSNSYKELGRKIFVLDCGRKTTKKSFTKQFISELCRIEDLIKDS